MPPISTPPRGIAKKASTAARRIRFIIAAGYSMENGHCGTAQEWSSERKDQVPAINCKEIVNSCLFPTTR